MRQIDRRVAIWTTTVASLAVGMLLVYACNHPAGARDIAPFVPTAVKDQDSPAPRALAAPTTSTSAEFVDYQDKGTHFHYPATWEPKEDKDYELHLVPAAAPVNCNITFDIPELPPHFPGMIRLGLIEHGWVNDQKNCHPGLNVDSRTDVPMAGANAGLVQCSWKQGGADYTLVGLLILRNDHVFILVADAEDKSLPHARADLDKIAASLHWDK